MELKSTPIGKWDDSYKTLAKKVQDSIYKLLSLTWGMRSFLSGKISTKYYEGISNFMVKTITNYSEIKPTNFNILVRIIISLNCCFNISPIIHTPNPLPPELTHLCCILFIPVVLDDRIQIY